MRLAVGPKPRIVGWENACVVLCRACAPRHPRRAANTFFPILSTRVERNGDLCCDRCETIVVAQPGMQEGVPHERI